MDGPSWVAEPDSSRTIEKNWLFCLRRERFRSRASGKSHNFYLIDLADAVNVIALTPDRRVVLVRQFRAGSNSDSLETPGGLLGDGEDPCAAGTRELLEETGFVGDPAVLIGVAWANPSILRSRIATILITNAAKFHEPHLDENEEVSVELYPIEQIPRMIRDGSIGHALAIAGLLLWMNEERPESQ